MKCSKTKHDQTEDLIESIRKGNVDILHLTIALILLGAILIAAGGWAAYHLLNR